MLNLNIIVYATYTKDSPSRQNSDEKAVKFALINVKIILVVGVAKKVLLKKTTCYMRVIACCRAAVLLLLSAVSFFSLAGFAIYIDALGLN